MWKWQVKITRTYNTGNQEYGYTLHRTKQEAIYDLRRRASAWRSIGPVNISPDGCLLVVLDGTEYARTYFGQHIQVIGYTTIVATVEKVTKGE